MGLYLFSKKSYLALIFSGLFELRSLRKPVIVKASSFTKLYRGASDVLNLDDYDSGSNRYSSFVVNEVGVSKKRLHTCEGRELLSIVVRVIKSLNWRVAREMRFRESVEKYGFPCAINAFRMTVHVFGFARIPMEMHSLLRDVVYYYQDVSFDLFDLLPSMLELLNDVETSAVLVDVLIKLFAFNSMLENAVDVFFQAKNIGIQPGIRSCNFLLRCLVEESRRRELSTLFKEMKNSGPSPCVYTYTILMNFYCNEQYAQDKEDMLQATLILEDMDRNGIQPSVVTYSTYIHGLCRVGCVDLALQLIQDLKHNDQPLDVYYFNAVMHAFCRNGKPDEAMGLLGEMRSYGVTPDVYSYSILIDGFCECEEIEKSLTLFEEMEGTEVNIKPSLFTYNSLLKGLSRIGVMEALKFLDEMTDQGINLNSCSYNVILNRLCKEGKSEHALELIPMMLKKNILPDVVACNTLMDGFTKQGKLEQALVLYQKMIKFGVTPDIITFTILINILFTMGEVREAYNLFEKMIVNDLDPNTICYTSVIDGLWKNGHVKNSLRLFEEMLQKGPVPSVVTYTCLIDGFCKRNRMDIAITLVDKMLRKGHIPSVVTYTCLIDGFCKQNRMDIATMLVDKMRRNNVSPNMVTYDVLIRGYIRQGQVHMLHYLFDEMRKEGIAPNDIICEILGLNRL